MYKISEVAEMLSVEKVKIFETLIVHDEVLSSFVTKERHLSYISDEGVRKIERIIFDLPEPIEEIEKEIEIIIPNLDEDCLEDESQEENSLDKKIVECIEKRNELKNEIIDLKRQVNLIDNELRHKGDAISNYQSILKEDLIWLIKLEAKVDSYRTDQLSEIVDDQKKTSFFKFKK